MSRRALTAADILGAADLARGVVDVPAWGGLVHVRELSLGERFEAAALPKDNPSLAAAWFVAVAATTPGGEPLFPPADRDATVAALMARAAEPVNAIAREIMRLSGYIAEAGADATEEAAGN